MRNNLVSERKRANLTRKEVGERIGRSEDVIGKWERGATSPSLVPDAVALAKLYGCSIDYLAGNSDERLPLRQIKKIS